MKQAGLSAVWIFAVVGLVVATGAVFFLFQNQNIQAPKKQPDVVESTVTPSQTVTDPTANPTPDPTSDWKTYSSTSYGLSFRYPQDYKVEERSPGFFVISTLSEHVPQGGISIDARKQGSYQTFDEAKTNINNTFTVSDSGKMNEWTTYNAVGKEDMLKGTRFKLAIAPYQTGAIEMETIDNEPYSGVFVKILSSFKFSP